MFDFIIGMQPITDRLVGQRELPVQSSLVYAARFSLVQKVA